MPEAGAGSGGSMLFAEDLLLLVTEDASGRLPVPAAQVDAGLGGANLAELTLMNKVGVSGQGDQGKPGRIMVGDPSPAGDEVLGCGPADRDRAPRQEAVHDRWRVAISIQVREPVCALSQPVHLVRYGVGDAVAAVEFGVLIAAGVFGGWPACCPQLAERRVQRVQAGTATSWCTREGGGPAAVARDLGSRSPSAQAETSAHVRSGPACPSRHPARETRVRTCRRGADRNLPQVRRDEASPAD